MTGSIRSRVLLVVTGVLAFSLAALALWSYRDAGHEIEEVFDAQLAQSARLIARTALAAGEAGTPALDDGARISPEYEGKLGWVVFDREGRALLASASAPVADVGDIRFVRERVVGESARLAPDRQAALRGIPAGYHEVLIGGRRWNAYLIDHRGGERWILVGDREDVRSELAGQIALRSMLPEIVGIPVIAALIWLAVGWGLAPLGQMARLLRSRDPGNLAPLVLERLPAELEPAVASLNRLLGQVTGLLEREKRFLSYAAHELRTPLAVLRLQADNALNAPDPADREASLRQLDRSVSRATRLVEQLLAMARLEPGTVSLELAEVDLLAFARREVAELGPMALDRGQDLSLEAEEGADHRVPADEACLESLLQNLLANAIRHAPPGGALRVRLVARPEAVEVHVEDSGPGIAPGMRERVFERFFREGPAQGAGLGLAIAARVAELHGGRIALGTSPLGGLDAVATLPRPAVPPASLT